MCSQQLIVNEFLAFVQNAIDTMDEVSIEQICKSNFNEDEICSGKMLLFQSCGKAQQMPSRRRDGGLKSVQDVTAFLKNTDPDDVPTFVAKELHKLPPVTFDHVDVTRLLKDITSLKSSLAEVQSKLEASDNSISELRAEVALLRNPASVCRSPTVSYVNTRRGARKASVGSIESARMSPVIAVVNAPCPPARPSASEVTSPVCTSSPGRAYAAVAATISSGTATSKPELRKTAKGGSKPRMPVSGIAGAKSQRQTDRCDEDGFTKVEKRRKKPTRRNLCGTALTGQNFLLRAAIPTTQLYLSRLHYSTKSEDIVEYIRLKAQFTLRVERLESRHNVNFNSFVVRVPTAHLSTFMQVEFWPKGVRFRRFRGTIHDTCLRHTSPNSNSCK
ncbi:uncharacterized protein LOC113236162 [Hyposmocoma kahamanoa]|uniref:uncharacterized protein LOC113236162 n=1 Tax=Hyposmocoma kahamanoa TaxID=1477025 RepID=UPI000E6D9A8D|nr:uncharacterized protein LOC113236162 [Hyposmocoma kahamanoa]